MYPGANDEAANKARIEANRARKSNARIYDGFPVRNWDHWLDERQVRIFVQALDADGLASGAARDLLAGTRLAANPGFAGRQMDTGEEMEMEFTPDDQSLVFAATTNRNQAAYGFTDSQLFVVSVAGGEPRALTSGMASWSWPKFTRDGGTLLALLEQHGPDVYNAARLVALTWPECRPATHRDRRHRPGGEQLRGHARFAPGVLHGRGCRQREAVFDPHSGAARYRPCLASATAPTPISRFRSAPAK